MTISVSSISSGMMRGDAGRRKSSSAIVEDFALDNDDGGVDSYSIESALAERGEAGACAELAEERVDGAGGVLAERDIDGTETTTSEERSSSSKS